MAKTYISGSGTITAYGGRGSSGSGIGGGYGGSADTIDIRGSVKVIAYTTGGAGIGGGVKKQSGHYDDQWHYIEDYIGGDGNNITIALTDGGAVYATSRGGSTSGAGIGGGGNGGSADTITIESGTVIARSLDDSDTPTFSACGAGIGGGKGVSTYVKDEEGKYVMGENGMPVQVYIGGTGSNITINGGNITAESGTGAGIGGGDGSTGSGITITGGEINATSHWSGAGIGGGKYGDGIDIKISSETTSDDTTGDKKTTTVTATSKGGGAGIGGGGGDYGHVAGSGDLITISGGTVSAASEGSSNNAGISGANVTIEGEKTVVNATGSGTDAGIKGSNITINGGTVTAKGGDRSDAGINGTTVSMGDVSMGEDGTSYLSYPWVYTDGINGLTESESSDLAIVFGLDGKVGTVYGTVKLTEKRTIGSPCEKLIVPNGAKLVTYDEDTKESFLTLKDNVILYLEKGAKLDKYDKMTLNGNSKIQHEDPSVYVPDTTSRAIKTVCDICGKEEPHNWRAVWANDNTQHWHECDPGFDCSVPLNQNQIVTCSITDVTQRDGYGSHEYDFDKPDIIDGKLHFKCGVCGYELTMDIPTIHLVKLDGTDAPLAGAEFGLYSNEQCTTLFESATTAINAQNKAVASFGTEPTATHYIRPDTTYYIKEITPPDGYTVSDKVFKAIVDKDGKVTYGVVGDEETSEYIPVFTNEKIISQPAKIIKVGSAAKNPLVGVEFGLYRDEQCTDRIKTAATAIDTDNKAVVSFDTELNTTYYIKEIAPPDGYKASDKVFKAVVDKYGKVTYGVVGSAGTSEEIPICENEKIIPQPAKIIKADAASGDPLAGVEFGLYRDEQCTDQIKTATTAIDNNKAVVSFDTELNTTYYIKEITPPNGYTASDKVFKAVVGTDGKVTYGVVGEAGTSPDIPVCENFADEVVFTNVKLIKVDSVTKNPLAGAEFGLYSDEQCTDQIKTATAAIDTDNKAVVSFTAEANKTYYIKETKAPSGYKASDKVFKAVVDADGKVTYGVVGEAGTSEKTPVCENEKSTANTNRPTNPTPSKGPSRPADTTPSTGTPSPADTTPPIEKPDPADTTPSIDTPDPADTTPPMTTTPPEIPTDPPKETTTPPPSDTTEPPVVTPAPDDPSVTPAATVPTKTDENPKTGVSLGIAGLAILSGVICAVSLSKEKQSGKKKKKNDNSKIDF